VVLGFIRESVRYARKVCRGSFEDGELVSICYSALTQAAKKYSSSHGIGFFAFGKQYIRGAVAREWGKRDIVKHSSEHEINETGFEKPCENDVALPDFDGIYSKEEWELVYPAIQKRLNAIERMVIVLRYRAGFSFEEVGRLRGVTRQAIQRTHREAILKLRKALSHKKETL